MTRAERDRLRADAKAGRRDVGDAFSLPVERDVILALLDALDQVEAERDEERELVAQQRDVARAAGRRQALDEAAAVVRRVLDQTMQTHEAPANMRDRVAGVRGALAVADERIRALIDKEDRS